MKQNLVDAAEFTATGGKGGDGAIAWRREKYIQKGGPDGGNGGKGGSIIFRVNDQLNTLRFFAGKDRFLGAMGSPGSKRGSEGHDAEDLIIEVPVGTVVSVASSGFRLPPGRQFYGDEKEEIEYSGFTLDKVPYASLEERWKLNFQLPIFNLPRLQAGFQSNPNDQSPIPNFVQIADLQTPGEEMVMAMGGRGGQGNKHYKSSIRTTPKFAQKGELGERYRVRLELKVLADVGLVGLPNVGKSTLLSVLTAARPEIANYPFTTLSPNLGVMDSLIIADIPGLIEDAHIGKGLGIDFLKHVERCKVLVYVLAAELNNQETITKEQTKTNDQEANNQTASELWEQYQVVKKEVESYSEKLLEKKSMVVINKVDLMLDARSKILDNFKKNGVEVLLVSGATHEGVDELKAEIIKLTSEKGP